MKLLLTLWEKAQILSQTSSLFSQQPSLPCSAHWPCLFFHGASPSPASNVPDSRLELERFAFYLDNDSSFRFKLKCRSLSAWGPQFLPHAWVQGPGRFQSGRLGPRARTRKGRETSRAEPGGSVRQPRCAQRALSPPGGSGRSGLWSFHPPPRGLALPVPQEKRRPRVPRGSPHSRLSTRTLENPIKPNLKKQVRSRGRGFPPHLRSRPFSFLGC